MGCDSAGGIPSEYWVTETELLKVFHNGPFMIGYTSSFRMAQLLQYQLDTDQLEAQHEDESDVAYLVRVVVEAIRELFKDHGFAEIESNVERGGVFMIAYRGKLYEVHANYQVFRRRDRYAAIGCGQHYAEGALYITGQQGFTPATRIELALEAAAKYSAYVRPPFHLEAQLLEGEADED